MVIQSNMSSKAFVEVWENTIDVFKKFRGPLSEKTLSILVIESILPALPSEFNTLVGSLNVTCIEGD